MSLYSRYSDDDLQGEIDDLKAKIIAASKADDAGLSAVAGEGRRLEWTSTVGKGVQQLLNLKNLLQIAEAEMARRTNCGGGEAIGVTF
jgi:hypothetical protein